MTAASAIADRREAARRATGQFGEQHHSAPEVTLTFDDLDAADARREAAAAARAEIATLLDAIEGAAGSFAAKRNQWANFDDIVGETVLQVFTGHAAGRMDLKPAGGVHIAGTVGWAHMNPGEHHTSRTARRQLNGWFDEFIQEHGRVPSSRERKAKAEQIRLTMPAGRRPTAGFEDRPAFVSLESAGEGGEDGEVWFGDSIPEDLTGSDYATSRTKAAAANDALENEMSSFKAADARKNIWNLLADDGPQVAVKSILDDRGYRAAVEEAGGPAAVARAWAAGETPEDDPATVGLFAPFGPLSQGQRQLAADVLTRNPAYADKIWDSAMSAAVDIQRLRAIKRRESRQAAALQAA